MMKDVADPASGAQAGLACDDRAQQLVGVQAALHQQLGLALAHQRDRPRRRGVAVRRVDDRASIPRSIPVCFGDLAILRAGPTRIGRDQSVRGRLRSRRPAPISSHGCATAVAIGSRLPASRQQLFVFSGSGFMSHGLLPCTRSRTPRASAGGRRGRSGFLQEERENDGQGDAVQQRLKRRLVVLERRGRRRRR